MARTGDPFAWPIAMTGLVVFGLLVRWLVLSRRELVRREEENELERARRAILEEKARIARDLHDVVAHHMSLVVVQAQTAPYRVADVSEQARAEFESIGASAREALNEVRGMLGVLRSDGQLPEHAPQPAAVDVLAVLDAARRAGVPVDWVLEGELAAVPDTAGLALYRIVQESLSNASRHAPGTAVRVTITVRPGAVEVVIRQRARRGRAERRTGNGYFGYAGPGRGHRRHADGGYPARRWFRGARRAAVRGGRRTGRRRGHARRRRAGAPDRARDIRSGVLTPGGVSPGRIAPAGVGPSSGRSEMPGVQTNSRSRA